MSTLKYQISNPEHWHSDLEQQIPVVLKDNTFVFKKNFGSGSAEYKCLQTGLWIEVMDFKLKDRLEVEVLPKPVNDSFTLTFWLTNSQVKQKVDDHEIEFKFDNVSVVLLSSACNSFYEFPKNENVKLFMIWVSRDWLLENAVGKKNKELRYAFENDAPIYLTENLDYRFKYILEQIDFTTSKKLDLLSKTIQLLNHFYKNIENHAFNNLAATNIHNSDLKQIIQVKDYIHSHPLDNVSLGFLSEMANMSLSKFKRLFKKVFGTTPYQYTLKNKLEIAMQMLQREDYSVSETGFMVGYSNLSQFSKAFKNQFGYLPSQVRL